MVVLVNTIDNEPLRDLCAAYDNRPDALLEILHTLQAREGWLSDDALKNIADILNISHAEIYGVVSFYPDFLRERPASTVLKICRAEACQAVGGEALVAQAQALCAQAEGTNLAVVDMYCLGNCALGPALMIGETLYGRVDAGQLTALVAAHADASEREGK